MQRRLSAIFAADMVGYSRLMAADEQATIMRQKEHRAALIDPKIAQYGGRIVKTMGDGLLVEFSSAVDAVQCALEIQRTMPEREAEVAEDSRIRYRIGVNLGDISIDGEDVLGDGVNVAARLEGLAQPGGICISDVVYQMLQGKLAEPFSDLGEQSLKNMSRNVRVWDWTAEEAGPVRAHEDTPLPLPDKPSIAVLPFANMSGDAEQEYFADGIVEDIITALSRFRSLFVIARNSSFAYKRGAVDVKQVGSDLGVRYVLEGSVRKSASRVRVTAQLIEAPSGVHLWAQRYDHVLEDVFELQDEITETIVAAIEPELEIAERERAYRKPPGDLDVWDNCQRGMWHSYKFRAVETEVAEKYFRAALENLPNYGPALAGLAYADFQRIILNFETEPTISREDLIERGIKRGKAAVLADDKDAFSQFVLGRLLSLKGKFDEAIERLNRAIELNPNYAIAYHGLGYALTLSGKPAEAVEQFDQALRLSPQDPYRWAFLTMRACAFMMNKDYEKAVETGRLAIQEQPDMFWPYAHLAASLGHLGRKEEAAEALRSLLAVKPDFRLKTVDETVRFRRTADREHFLSGLREAGLES